MMQQTAKIAIIMGSQSDLPVMQQAAQCLNDFSMPYELTIISAHRTPERMLHYAKTAIQRNIQVIIAGAGGAAHLPGMVASMTPAPVIGVPIKSSNSIDGWDSVLSILQMPDGVPVATVALNGAENAALLALRMLALHHSALQEKIAAHQKAMQQKVLHSADEVAKTYLCRYKG